MSASNRLSIQFSWGETYTTLIRRNRGWFTATSDTEHTYIIRGDKQIGVNSNRILYDAEYQDTMAVEENDILLVQFRQLFVTVSGAVPTPGRYPYIPDRDWNYYVSLAGGFSPERNRYQTVEIRDIKGERRTKTEPVSPETIIEVKTDSIVYGFNRIAPLITTLLTIVSTFISLILLIQR